MYLYYIVKSLCISVVFEQEFNGVPQNIWTTPLCSWHTECVENFVDKGFYFLEDNSLLCKLYIYIYIYIYNHLSTKLSTHSTREPQKETAHMPHKTPPNSFSKTTVSLRKLQSAVKNLHKMILISHRLNGDMMINTIIITRLTIS